MTTRNQFLRYAAAVLALAVPLSLAAVLYWMNLPRTSGRDVVRCGEAVQGQPSPSLALTAPECVAIADAIRVVYDKVPEGSELAPMEAYRSPIKVGAPPPAGIEPLPLPPSVPGQFPRLEGYRYFLAGDDIALVGPGDAHVVAFVEVHKSPR